jgi:drug/metabolite transporter (DMT)-like permease
MYKFLELAPLLIPIAGAGILYKYRYRLRGVLGIAILGVFFSLASAGLGVMADHISLFMHDVAAKPVLGEVLMIGRSSSLAVAWLCLLGAALKNRSKGRVV